MKRGRFDVIVLGGGIGGLTTGAILAANGMRILLLERNEIVGGRLRAVRRDGFSIPVGPHGFPRDAVDTALARAQVEAPLYPRPGHFRLYNLRRKQLYGLMEAGRPWEETVEKFGLSPEDSRGLLDQIHHVDPETWSGKTARRWLDDMRLSARLKKICANSAVWATDGAMTVDVISMDLFPLSVLALFIGELTWVETLCDQELNEALRRKIESTGAVECNAEVISIEVENDSVGRVTYTTPTTGSLWEARAAAVVNNVPILELGRRRVLSGPLPAPLEARMRALDGVEPYLGGLITVWYGLRRPLVPGTDPIAFFGEDPETGTQTIPLGYFQAYSNAVPTVAPAGGQLVFICGYVRPHERHNWSRIVEKARELDELARRYVEGEQWGSLDDVLEFQETTIGLHLWGAYNWSIFRPYLPETVCGEIRGFYSAGNMVQSTPGLFGVAGAMDSGVRAADAVLNQRERST